MILSKLPMLTVERNPVLQRAWGRLERSWRMYSFSQAAKGILGTSPLQPRGDSPMFLSMLCHRDLVMYLLAIKSLYMRTGHGHVAIINDGSLTSADLALLQHHIPGLQIFHIDAIEAGVCPRGGT